MKPGKTAGKPIVEDYNGPRTAKGIIDAVIDKIPNHVKRVDDKTLESWLAEANDTTKAILFTDKGKTSALLKSVAIEFKDSISVAQIRNTDKEKASLELFGITSFPTLLLLPGGKEAEGIAYDGELNKAAMVDFLSKSTDIYPNQDPAPAKVKLPKSKNSKKASKEKAEFEASPASQAKEEGSTASATATEEIPEEAATPYADPIVQAEKPIVLPAPMIPFLSSVNELAAECLGPKTGTCVIALLADSGEGAAIAAHALGSLSEVAHRHKIHKRNIFPFYVLPQAVAGYDQVREVLGLASTDVIAVNSRRGWWRKLPVKGDALAEVDIGEQAIESWIDSIRLGEGVKEKIPQGLIPEDVLPEEAVVEEPATEEPIVPEPEAEKPIILEEVQVEEEDVHDEL